MVIKRTAFSLLHQEQQAQGTFLFLNANGQELLNLTNTTADEEWPECPQPVIVLSSPAIVMLTLLVNMRSIQWTLMRPTHQADKQITG